MAVESQLDKALIAQFVCLFWVLRHIDKV
jgi:hypothetical protein